MICTSSSLLCPNTIVRDRLEDDFKDAKVFRDFGFLPPGMEHFTNELGLHVMEPGGSAARNSRLWRGAGEHPAALPVEQQR